MYSQSRQNERARQLQGRISMNESRKKREESTISIRKNKRREGFQKRRQIATNPDNTYQSQATNEQERIEELNQLVAMLRSDNVEMNYEATFRIRGLLSSEDNPPITQVINTGVVPRIVEFLSYNQHPKLQFEAAWALTNIASGTSEQTRYVLDLGTVPKFRDLLSSPVQKIREQSIWALGNIAGDSVHTRDFVLANGVLEPLLKNLEEQMHQLDYGMLRNATWTLSNLCRRKPAPRWESVVPCLPTLSRLVFQTDDDVLTDTCWTLSYLSDGTNKQIHAVVELGISRRLVELLQHPSFTVITPALRTIGNIVTGDETQTQVMVNVSVLPCLLALLNFPRKSIRKEACWTISNITAGTESQIGAVINAGVFPELISRLSTAEFEVKREAGWAISNAISGGSSEQISEIVNMGLLPPLLEMVTKKDATLAKIALGTIENLLKAGAKIAKKQRIANPFLKMIYECNEGHKRIELAQHHQDEDVYDKAHGIVIKYFSEQEEDQNLLPNVTRDQGFSFGVQNDAMKYAF